MIGDKRIYWSWRGGSAADKHGNFDIYSSGKESIYMYIYKSYHYIFTILTVAYHIIRMARKRLEQLQELEQEKI